MSSLLLSLYDTSCKIVENWMVTLHLDLHWTWYRFLYPPKTDNFDPDTIEGLVTMELFPTFKTLAPVIVCCALFSIVRFVFHHLFFKRFALKALNFKDNPIDRNSVLDKALPSKDKKMPSDDEIRKYCDDRKRNFDDTLKYIKMRYRAECAERKISKFIEAFWRCLFYTIFVFVWFKSFYFVEGGPIDWVQDLKGCWTGWPSSHTIIPMLLTYHHVQLGCYLHQLLWTEVTRSDALEMTIHHIVTITLITISYLINLQRIGSVIMVVHDLADIFLESAKLCNYIAKADEDKQSLVTIKKGDGDLQAKGSKFSIAKLSSDILFAIFAVVFFVTRLIYLPFFILRSVYSHGGANGFDWLDNTYMGGKVVVFSLSTLQVLHLFWFYTICKMVYKLVTTGIEGDERSDDEEGNPFAKAGSIKSESEYGIKEAHALPGRRKISS